MIPNEIGFKSFTPASRPSNRENHRQNKINCYIHLNEQIRECLRWSYRTSCTDTNVFLRSCPVSDQHTSDQHTSLPPLMLSFWLSLFFVARARLFRTRIDEDIAQSSQPPYQTSDIRHWIFKIRWENFGCCLGSSIKAEMAMARHWIFSTNWGPASPFDATIMHRHSI